MKNARYRPSNKGMSDRDMVDAAVTKLPPPPKAPSFGPARPLYVPSAEVAQGETVRPMKGIK